MSDRAFSRAWAFAGLAISCTALAHCANGTEEVSFGRSAAAGRASSAAGGGGSEGGDQGGASTTEAAGGTAAVLKSSPITVVPGSGSDSGSGACEPVSCHPTGGDYCGKVGNGCGTVIDCGTCPKDGWVCESGLCKGGPDCVPRTSCNEGTATYCGKIGDGCGGELDCGNCSAPETCGGTGIANLCGDPNCSAISCSLPVGQYCGVVGDGCGRSMDCGSCPDGAECGGEGIAGVCPGSSGGLGCSGIKCNVVQCASGTTSVSGVVYDPAGVNPLYNVTVYVPNAALDTIPTGATCEQCNAVLSGEPITTALTDSSGRFRLDNVPPGTDIPLVIQVGRWRRKVVIPKVEACQETVLTDRQMTRLPRNHTEGDIPRIAITTGGADALECLIPRIGLDRSEVTTDTGTGRIHLYAGGFAEGASTTTGNSTGRGATSMTPGGKLSHASTLWGSAAKMRGYDIVMFSCEGGESQPPKDAYLANFQSYVDNGGRAFLTHYHYYWLNHGSLAFQGTANYVGDEKSSLGEGEVIGAINTSFPKGAALADWLSAVGATTTRAQLPIWESRNSLTTVNPPTQDWINLPGLPNRTQYLTFNTPVGAPTEQQCGRVVFTDLHIGAAVSGPPAQGGDTSTPTVAYPNGCSSNPMSPQIKALEFIFFDLAACVTPDFETPLPPTPPPATVAAPPGTVVPPPPPPPVPG